jgi:hypothetical protein
MRQHMVTALTAAVVVMFLVGSGLAQDTTATIRTYQGVSYKVADPSLEVFYTIGEPKEKEEPGKFQPAISISTSATTTSGGEQAAGGAQEAKLLRGHSRASDITVSRQGVETRIALEHIRAMRFARKPVTNAILPPYVPYYKYSVTVSLMSGQQVEADYVNLGMTIVRGASQNGRVDIPWEEVEDIAFER